MNKSNNLCCIVIIYIFVHCIYIYIIYIYIGYKYIYIGYKYIYICYNATHIYTGNTTQIFTSRIKKLPVQNVLRI